MIPKVQIEQIKQVFDFCFSNEKKVNPFQIQLNYSLSEWNENSVGDIEEFFKADLIKLYLNTSAIDIGMVDMGFTPVNKLNYDDAGFNNCVYYLDYHYNKSTNKPALIACIEDFVLEVQYTKAQSFGKQIEHIPATLTTDIFDVQIKGWLLKKRRSEMILSSPIKPAHIPDKTKLSIREVALLLFYIGEVVTEQNANGIIKLYGYNSGRSLYNDYTHYSKKDNRTAIGTSQNKMKNLAKNIERIIPLITDNDAKNRAVNDLKSLKHSIENYI